MPNTRKPSLVVKNCLLCGDEFSFRSSGETNNAIRRFCGTSCAAKWRNQNCDYSEGRAKAVAAMVAATTGKSSPESSRRMKANNPMSNPETRAKMAKSLQGRTFLARGGNGKPTKPQLLLAEKTGLPMEYVIETGLVKDQFTSVPNCYKVDLADPTRKLAIEVDGKTHKLKRWKFLDKRKTEILNALGWTVIRFSNEQVMEQTESVLGTIETYC